VCYVEKYGYLFLVRLIAFLVKLLEPKICIIHVGETFYIVFVYCIEHGKNAKSVV
jgi:uncharacterized membrane protein